jgi:hypothetical protein
MLHNDLNSASKARRLLSVTALAAVAATVVFGMGVHPQAGKPASTF